jgi:large subunit ribosomal protein L19
METNGITISPVNIEDRKELGIKVGDTVRVWQKIQEKGKIRLQAFEGMVLARKHGNEPGSTFTVRRVSSGVGVEKIFPLYAPTIDKIEIVRRAKVRRAKLYYVRDKAAREIKRHMRNMVLMNRSTESDTAAKEVAAKTEEKSVQTQEDVQSPKEQEAGAVGK